MIEIRLVKYKQAEAQLLDLFRASFGRDINPDFWHWKHAGNYLSPADPEVIAAVENDRIVGARPFLFVEMWLGNEKVKAAQHVDTMVHPEYQKRGVFNLVGQFSINYLRENGYALSYGFANRLSRQGFMRQGYRVIGATDIMFKLLRPRRVMSHQLKNKALSNIAGFLYDKFMTRKTRKQSGLPATIRFTVAEQFTEELRQVDTLRDEKAVDLVRSEDFLRWRYDAHPHFKYRYIILKREEELAGYAVISPRREISGLTQGTMVDFLVKNDDAMCTTALINKCLIELEQSGCDYANIWTVSQSNQLRKSLRRSGLKSVLKFPYRREDRFNYLDARLIQEGAAGYIDIYDKENWRMSAAFSDTR